MKRFKRSVAGLLIVCIAGLGMPLPAGAAMVSTEKAVKTGQIERISELLGRDEVRAQLERYGVGAEEVKARVAAMTDEEAALLAEHMEELPAGGVLGLIVAVFIILLITDILGFTKVFPFTRAACDRGRC